MSGFKNGICTYNGILFHLKKGGDSAIRDNREEAGGYYVSETIQSWKDDYLCEIP